MYVVKRDGRKEPVKFDKITARIVKMCYGLDPLVSPEAVAMKVIEGIYDGVTTSGLDNLAAEVAAAKTIDHPDYALLASRIIISNLHKETKKTFSDVVQDLYNYTDPKPEKAHRFYLKRYTTSLCKTRMFLIQASYMIVTSDMITLGLKL